MDRGDSQTNSFEKTLPPLQLGTSKNMITNEAETSDTNRESGQDVQMVNFINWVIVFVFTPVVASLGVVGNCLSVIILVKQGLRKSSNILLVALAVADISYMLGSNSALKLLYQSGQHEGFISSEGVSRACFYLYQISDVMDWGGGTTSMGLPTLITLERFIAVFFPFQFHHIVTPRRTVCAVVLLYTISFGLQLYARSWYSFVYAFDNVHNITVGLVQRSDFFWRQQAFSEVLDKFYTLTIIPFSIVSLGCVAIGIRIRFATRRRQVMTHAPMSGNQLSKKMSSSTSRTTRTLLSVCAVYTVACLFVSLPSIFPQFTIFPKYLVEQDLSTSLVYNTTVLVLSVNGASNFIIYVATNNLFRNSFLAFLGIKTKSQ